MKQWNKNSYSYYPNNLTLTIPRTNSPKTRCFLFLLLKPPNAFDPTLAHQKTFRVGSLRWEVVGPWTCQCRSSTSQTLRADGTGTCTTGSPGRRSTNQPWKGLLNHSQKKVTDWITRDIMMFCFICVLVWSLFRKSIHKRMVKRPLVLCLRFSLPFSSIDNFQAHTHRQQILQLYIYIYIRFFLPHANLISETLVPQPDF